jgi:hypothetical protein
MTKSDFEGFKKPKSVKWGFFNKKLTRWSIFHKQCGILLGNLTAFRTAKMPIDR